MRNRLTYSNVVATLALFTVLGGASYAATNLPKNSVGTKQIKKNSVSTEKIKNKAVTGAKIKNGTVTGAEINLSTLGTVPTADAANSANSARSAAVANSLPPPEPWHQVGTPGEPPFEKDWKNLPQEGSVHPPTVAFYKDHDGVVHLRGVAIGMGLRVFRLPTGYRPGPNIELVLPGVTFYGSGINSSIDGIVAAEGEILDLNGIAFPAES